MKHILITGANSYIGISVKKWLENNSGEYDVEVLDVKNANWKTSDFRGYDVVFHVAGMAHSDIEKATEKDKDLYYKVNTFLAFDVAFKAKSSGIKQFILMSSIIVYGDSAPVGKEKVITLTSTPTPANFYGDSKLQAEKKVLTLKDETFNVSVIRSPMVYGKGSKGNYPLLSRIACKLPVFPNINNRRSMLYIDNLCEFVRLIIDSNLGGILFPQNSEYVNTTYLVKMIASSHNKKILVTKFLNCIIILSRFIPGKINKLGKKAFGSLIYEKNISNYQALIGDYQIVSFEESIKVTESE